MNCRIAKKRVTESCASGLAALPPSVRAHLGSCVECRLFYEQETNLFAALDTGLQNLVNQPVPSSLLPRVRAALEQTPAPRPLAVPAWGLAALAAALVLVLSLGPLSSRVQRRAFERQPVVSQPGHPPASKAPSPLQVAASNAARRTKASSTPLAKRPQSRPEVIVLAEEREAFAQFLADRAKEPLELVAAPKALEKTDSAVDIALLKIKQLEIEPLEGTAAE